MIEEDLEEASGRGDTEDWFEEGGCPESSKVEGRKASNCRRNRVNPAISAKGTIPDKNRRTTATTTTVLLVNHNASAFC